KLSEFQNSQTTIDKLNVEINANDNQFELEKAAYEDRINALLHSIQQRNNLRLRLHKDTCSCLSDLEIPLLVQKQNFQINHYNYTFQQLTKPDQLEQYCLYDFKVINEKAQEAILYYVANKKAKKSQKQKKKEEQ
ncbi:hypothetical protein RFI_26418, partial [Reticulomyxa filosa]